ncbi:unnamed protein product [Caenorhabditis auriculariae]|uniref:Transthyretin-like family protein n=1 Tax=Caenorhabditis auriculariae TaxID=2777116 RepID=A0A8S1HY50_9PELO|nr:unnamed protein product [Caenorhabditis auriculariae]
MSSPLVSLFFLFCFCSYSYAGRVHVRGNVHCSHRANRQLMTVRLMEEDFSEVAVLNWFDSDDNLDETQVAYGEHFTVDGSEFEFGGIEPYIEVYHHCFGSPETVRIEITGPEEGGAYRLGDLVLDEGSRYHVFFNEF